MIDISEKTLQDLEFPTICKQLAEFCLTEKGKEKALALVPKISHKRSYFSLLQTQEYKSSSWQEVRIPNHGFDKIDKELDLLGIENSRLELNSFRKLKELSITATTLQLHFEKYKEVYPMLYQTSSSIEHTLFIHQRIEEVVNRFGEIKNEASPLLQQIRKNLNSVKSKIGSSFASALGRYSSYGYLDDIRESIVENVRVLAVTAMHRRKVKGRVLGHSKTGSIVYIQPEETQHYDTEFNNLQYEEHEEIQRILLALTDALRPFVNALNDYQKFLSEIDLISAKVKYAELYNGILPKLTKDKEIYLKDAFHPLLLIDNNKKNTKTYPQDIRLDKDNQIIVISGPNAGGKSITLKTVGLVQLMLHTGMLVPVHEYSRLTFFDKILTDIGDNQSIENHLSTYSYRLKNMRKFLKKCDENTLFLIDEFGTGTDPELGGALAETFLEVFYEKQSFGIITTHYANLKMMANENKEIVNANMMFDAHSLEPIFKLKLGEAGSSFTFEVAQKNGIPYSLINRSKKKVERGKIRFDKSIAKLQMERSKLAKTNSELQNKKQEAAEEQEKFDEINARIQDKLEKYQELYDSNQRMINLGEKINSIGEKYFNSKNKKQLISDFLKVIEKENSKRIKETKKEQQRKKREEHRVKQELSKKVEKIREKKKVEKEKKAEKEKLQEQKPKVKLKLNDSVRMVDGKAVGTINKFEKNKVVVNYGAFTTSVSEEQLELVKRAK
ncbi:endonuclease MutS2 [Psychroflexus salis]|uniref:Endonuclease MutS2 n=1 Tax=Psychroflexus salis TaxID=1526574 RepID=A0A916ZSY8_9FLAO|nr:DNA mismatch repair protein MutS [Psychroflexus salis]GGE12655.1 endonuclease MutS2 [Psychroflexus salis]